MKHWLNNTFENAFLVLISLILITGCNDSQNNNTVRTRVSFNDGWKFLLKSDSSAVDTYFDDSSWRVLELPHDWSIEGEFSASAPAGVGGGALPGGTGWYRKTFDLPAGNEGKLVFIEFDGVYCNSDVWLNGHHLGFRPNGYISFRYDITGFLKIGEKNTIVVRVDNSRQPNSRWYSGSGIYRNVWMVITDPVHIDHYGTFVKTPVVSIQEAAVSVETRVANNSGAGRSVKLITEIRNADGKTIASSEADAEIAEGETKTYNIDLIVPKPQLWSVTSPTMYRVVSTLKYDNKIRDRYETPFGIRTFEFDPYKGFSLNGESMKLLGVCNHHDLGSLGAAVNTRAIERQLEILRGMGVNAIRTAHNPPAPELLELCDRMGFLVMDEVFDMWRKKKSEYDYSMHWDEWHARDLEDFVRRDRNHPSVIIWSIGNEIGEQWDSTGTRIARELAAIVRRLDDTRPITTGNNEASPGNSIIKSGVLDIIGYNYNHADFATFHERYPGQRFIATETTSALATRGHYDMPSDSIRRWPIAWDKLFTDGNKDNTVSAYDNVSAPWGSTHEETWKVMKKHAHLSGMFIWTGFDYLGEPTPYVWPSRSSYFGVIDLAGFPKDTYYMYQSEWTTQTMLHVFPHWNWESGRIVDVWAYYNNADEAELFLNNESQGVKKKTGDDLHVMWRLKYEPGEVKVVTRRNGEQILSKSIRTAGEAARIILEADRNMITADGKDLSFVSVTIVDKDGNVVPHADNEIVFEVKGGAVFRASDNGDPTSHEPFSGNRRKAFNGKCVAIVQSGKDAGTATLTAASPGLESSRVTITMKK